MGNSVSTSGGGQQVSPPPDRTAQPAALPLTEELLKKHVAAGSDEEEVSGCAALAARGGRATPGGVGPPPARCCCFWQCFVLGYCRLPRAAGLRWGCVCCRAAPQPGFRLPGCWRQPWGCRRPQGAGRQHVDALPPPPPRGRTRPPQLPGPVLEAYLIASLRSLGCCSAHPRRCWSMVLTHSGST